MTSFLLWFCLDSSIDDYIPTSIDFLQYWKEVYNFRNCVDRTGYFGHEELLSGLNALGISSPGASHGIGNTLFYAMFALPVWQFDTPIYINMALTALGLALFVPLSGLPPKRLWLAGLAVASLYPLYYLNAINTFQSAHFFFAAIVAGLVVRILDSDDPRARQRAWLWLLLTVAAGALLRKNWALLLIPLAFLPEMSTKRRMLAVLGALVAAGALGACFDASRSPYPYAEFPEDLRPIVLSSLARGELSVLWRQITINSVAFLHFLGKHDFDTIYGAFLFVAGGLLLIDARPGPAANRFRWFGALSLILAVASSAVIYYIFQVMLLKIVLQAFLILVLVAARHVRPRALILFVAINVLFVPAFFDRYRQIGLDYLYSREKKHNIDVFREQTEAFFTGAADRWGNTLLIFDYPTELLGLPPCIHVMDTRQAYLSQRGYRVRTGFVLVPDAAIEERLLANNTLRLLATTTAGRLYAVE